MNAFQILALTFSASIVVLVAAAVRRRKLSRAAAMAWAALWLLAAGAIARPELTVVAARALGIDRGADLVFYLGILAMLGGFFIVFGRLWRIERNLTEIVRRLALWEAQLPAETAGVNGTMRPPSDETPAP